MRLRIAALLALGSTLVWAQGAGGQEGQVPPSLVFERGDDLYRIALDGSDVVQLTATKAQERSPAVSTDHSSIAYVRGKDELWLMNTDGSNRRRIVGARPAKVRYASTGSPSWSPGGRTIYFHRWSQPADICSSVYRIGADGRGLKRITDGVLRRHSESDPAVSPDGRRIAISASHSCDPGWRGRLAVIESSGRRTADLARLRSTPGVDIQPTWAPDGLRLAFVAYEVGQSERSAVYVVALDGSGLHRVTPRTPATGEPAWSDDGAWIAFAKEGGLFLVHPDGTGLQRVPGTTSGDGGPAWLPRS